MRKGSDLLGKVVVTYDTGEKIERVQDLIFDETSNQLLGLLVSEKRLFRRARVIPFVQVQAIGRNAIVVPSRKAVTTARSVPEIRAILKRNNVLKGTRIITVNGRDLGTIIDLYFDDETGAIEGYEVSGGLFADAYSGRSFVPAPHALKIGEDVAFVPVETAELMQEQIGGLRGVVQTANDSLQATTAAANRKLQEASDSLQTATVEAGRKLQEATQIAADHLQETTETTGRKLQDLSQTAIASLTNTIVDPAEQKAFAIGKVVDQNVFAPDGTLLVMQGQPVSLFVVEEAEQLGVLDQLYRATGGQLVDPLNQKLQETADATGRQIRKAANQTHESLQEITTIADEKLRDAARNASVNLTNAIVDPAEQMALVIDRSVDRDIYTPSGTLLIAKGQTVTLAIAEAAQQQGILDQLFRATGGSLTNELTRSANNLLASRLLSQAEGRRVQRTVQTNDGLILAAAGQIVTPQVIERVRSYQQEQALLSAVGLTQTEAAQATLNRTLTHTSDQFADGMTQFQESANTLASLLREKFEHLRQQAARILEERRMKQALGRPVNRIILDQQDNVILNPGDIITHHAIERARQANVVDILFSSVYVGSELPMTKNLPAAKEEVVVKVS